MVNPFVLSVKVRPICLRDFSGMTSQQPVESWRALGESLVYFDPQLNAFTLTHIVEDDKWIPFNIENQIKLEIKQNNLINSIN